MVYEQAGTPNKNDEVGCIYSSLPPPILISYYPNASHIYMKFVNLRCIGLVDSLDTYEMVSVRLMGV